LESQRREASETGYAPNPSRAYYASSPPSPPVSLAREKEEAINRILYDGDGVSARDRLEERRKKRQAEKAGSHTGFPTFFSQDRKGQAPAPAEPAAPVYEPRQAPAAPPVEERPRRSFSSEFVFTEKPAPAPYQAERPAEPGPVQQTFAVPHTPEAYAARASFPEPQPASVYAAPEPAAPADAYFALTPSDDEQAKFDIDKKNEEFQELLDKEFERLKRREPEATDIKSQFEKGPEAVAPPAEADIRSYIEERVDAYLRQSDFDMTRTMRSREEEEKPRETGPAAEYAPVFAPAPEKELSYDDFKMFDAPAAPVQDAAEAFGKPGDEFVSPYTSVQAPVYAQEPVPEPVSEPIPVPVPEAAPAPGYTPQGFSRNAAPTRESVAEFLDRPINFPFDTPAEPAAEAGAAKSFDFEPIKPAEPETHEEVIAETFTAAPEPQAETFETAQTFAAPFSLEQFATDPALVSEPPAAAGPFAAEIPAAPADTAAAPARVEDPADWFVTAPSAAPPEAKKEEDFPGPAAPAAETAEEKEAGRAAEPVPAAPSPAPEPPAAPAPAAQAAAPDFVDLMTEKTAEDEDQDGPPKFYKEYTQGFSVTQIGAAGTAAAAQEEAKAQSDETVPEFLTAYDNEKLGQQPDAKKDAKAAKLEEKQKRRRDPKKQSEAKRTALSVVITILTIILVIVVACIIILKLAPDSFGAYYIQDFVKLIQEKIGIDGA